MSVLIYTTPTCPWCKKTKEYLKEREVGFEEIDVVADKDAASDLFEKSGQLGVPVVDINGVIIIGFDKEAINQALDGKTS